MPEQILIDVTALEIGKSVHLGEVKAPEGVEILSEKEPCRGRRLRTRAPKKKSGSHRCDHSAADVEMTGKRRKKSAEGAARKRPPAKGDAKAAAPAGDAKAGAKPEAKAAEKKK